MLIAAFPECKEIGKKVAHALNAEYTTIVVKDFPDSEFHLKLKKNPRHEKVVIINSLSGEPDRKIIQTLFAEGIARDYRAKEVILVATYFPYMRQDKHFHKYDSFSSKYIMGIFHEFDKIIAIDPHLHRIHHLSQISKKATSISTDNLVADYINRKFKNDFEIIGPDSESRQWSSVIARKLKKKVIILKKERIGDRKIKQKFVSLGHVKNVIIIDDIISTGKTLLGAIEMAKKQGARKIYCIGIHGILIDNSADRIRKYAELITTNTIPNRYAKIDVSPIIIDELKKFNNR